MIALAAMIAALLTVQAPMPKTIDKGERSNVDSAKQAVVRTEAEWKKLWQQHSPDRKKPSVDFSKEMVIGVFMGSRSSAGFGIAILGTSVADGKMVVRYQETMPAKGAMTAQIITSPYQIVTVPKAAGEVKFEKVEKTDK